MLFRNKANPGSGFTDIHCHILPGIDDGATTLDESLEMLRLAVAGGTARVIATPHADAAMALQYDSLIKLVLQLNTMAQDSGIDIKVELGAEYTLDWGLDEAAEDKRIIRMAGSDAILVELPFSQLPEAVWTILFQLKMKGYLPIIAHPERCSAIQSDFLVAQRLYDEGYQLQVNSGSLLGLNGAKCQKTALKMVMSGLVSNVASDAHSPRTRNPDLQKVFMFLQRRLGAAKAKNLFVFDTHQNSID